MTKPQGYPGAGLLASPETACVNCADAYQASQRGVWLCRVMRVERGFDPVTGVSRPTEMACEQARPKMGLAVCINFTPRTP